MHKFFNQYIYSFFYNKFEKHLIFFTFLTKYATLKFSRTSARKLTFHTQSDTDSTITFSIQWTKKIVCITFGKTYFNAWYEIYTEKKCYWINSISFQSMYITDSNQYAIELVLYLLVLAVYFYEFIVYMLLERNTFDSIAFFSQCTISLYQLIAHASVRSWTVVNQTRMFFTFDRSSMIEQDYIWI